MIPLDFIGVVQTIHSRIIDAHLKYSIELSGNGKPIRATMVASPRIVAGREVLYQQ